ncbi:MAG TPA: DUF748 domain-containing protein [Nitrospiraceae bacterium]|nr:DUF748 domain-containing protein [Nitrospiraceae bacterium]
MPILKRYRTWLIVAGCLLVLYAFVGFFAVPYTVKRYVIPMVSETLRHPVLLGEMTFNPFTFAVTLSDLDIREQDGTSMAGFHELFINFEATSLVRRAYLFDEIKLTLPFGSVVIGQDGKLNLLSLVPPPKETSEPPPAPRPKAKIPPIQIRELVIRQGVLEYRDVSKARPVNIDVVPIEITLRNFSTREGGENAYAFSAEFGQDETLAWEGTLSLDPLESEGTLSLSNIKLSTFWPSVRDRFRFDLTGGAITLSGRYHFDVTDKPVNIRLTEGKILLSGFSMTAPGDLDPVIDLTSLGVEGIRFDLPRQSVEIEAVRVSQPRLRILREPDGSINFEDMLIPPRPQATPTGGTAGVSQSGPSVNPNKSWSIGVQEVELTKGAITIEDQTLQHPAEIQVDDLTISLKEIHMPVSGAMPLSASLRLNRTGVIETKGRIRLEPIEADFTVSVDHLGLRPFQPYMDRFLQVEITEGEFGLAGEVNYRAVHEAVPMLRYAGKLGITNLHVRHRPSDEELLNWKALGLTNVVLAFDPTSVRIGEIALRDPAVRVVTAPDGRMNITQILLEQDTGSSAAPKPANRQKAKADTAGPTPISIDRVTLENFSATFVDESIDPRVMTGLYDLSGSIKGLSSKQVAKADVSLAGKVDRVAPIKIQGKINPLSSDTYTDLKVVFQGIDLTAVSPYAGKYVGFPIEKGRLSLDLAYRLSQKQLVGENKVLIDQFTFGESTNSRDATSLPVRLAVALLKDRHGRIDIDLPVRGDLNEPDFRYGRVVLNTLVNLITKVATSPFAALGGLVGGSGDELQYLEFEAGSHELVQSEQAKLSQLAKALEERPALRLEITGSADRKRDRDAIALGKIGEEVQRRFTQGGKKNLQSAPSMEREAELLGDLYAEKVGRQATKTEVLANGKSVVRVLSPEEIRTELISVMPVTEGELRTLAQRRAQSVREALVGEGKVPEDRLFLVDVDLVDSKEQKVRTRLNVTGA